MIMRTDCETIKERIGRAKSISGYELMQFAMSQDKNTGSAMYRNPEDSFPVVFLKFTWEKYHNKKFKKPLFDFKFEGPEHLLDHLRKTAFAGLWEIR